MGTWGTKQLSDTELDREDIVRGAAECPLCAAPRGVKCVYYNHLDTPRPNRTTEVCSHTARYDVAAALGLVPVIPPSPGRGVPMLSYQTIPPATWTRLLDTDIEAEVFQDTGRNQNVIIEGTRLRWPNAHTFPVRSTILLRPPGGTYPQGWVAPLEGSWWFSDIPIGLIA